MNAKKLLAFVAVAIMVFAPMAVMVGDVNADDKKAETGSMVKLQNVDYNQVKGLVREHWYMGAINNGINEIARDLDLVSNPSLLKVEETNFGKSNIEMASYISKTACENMNAVLYNRSFEIKDFSMKLSFTKDAKCDEIISTLSGDVGKQIYKSLSGVDAKKDDKITITGNITYKCYSSYQVVYKSVADGKYIETSEPQVSEEVISGKLTVVVEGKTFEFDTSWKNTQNYTTEYEYFTELSNVKAGVQYFYWDKPSESVDKTSVSLKVDGKTYSYNFTKGVNSGDPTVKTDKVLESDLKTSNDFKINDYDKNETKITLFVIAENDEQAVSKVKAISGCDASTEASKANEVCNNIKSSIEGKTDNTATIIGIVIAVIVVLALIALWYFKFRPTPEVKTEAPAEPETPVQPEEPKNENQ